MRRSALLLILCCGFLQPVFAQQFWEKKTYTEWSDKQVRRILENSPWAQQFTVSDVKIEIAGPQLSPKGPSRAARERGLEQNPRIIYTVQFRSAKPMRQALIRRVQIEGKYDSMATDRKAAADRRAQDFLNAPAEEIMVYIGFETNVPAYALDLQQSFSSLPPSTVPNDTFLNAGGEKLSPTSYEVVTGGVQLTFKRPQNLARTGEISLEFMSPKVGDLASTRAFVRFKLKDMVVADALEL